MGSFNPRVKNRSGKLGGLTTDRPDSFHRSTKKVRRSILSDGNYELLVHKWVLSGWGWCIDLFGEEEK